VTLRFRNTLAILTMLFVSAVSCQATACEIACGLRTQVAGCHSDTQASASDQSDAMDMSGGHCPHMATQPAQQADFNVSSPHHGSCTHPAAWAFEKSGSPDGHLVFTCEAVLYVMPVVSGLSARDLLAATSPPPRLASTDPLVISLRV
jgi:hypothetical protein